MAITDMNQVPLRFSIATPTRNSLDKLKRCVGSVRGQSNARHEHIVQDANSSDGTSEWLSQQLDICGVSETDTGMYDAINRAWSRANGDILAWLNSDEQYLPGTLDKVQSYFDAHPQVDVVFGNYVVADIRGQPVALRREIPFRRAYTVNGFLNMQSATIFYRRHLWDAGLLRLDTRYRYAADKDLILRISSAGAVIRHIPDYLAIFGIDGTNLSTHPQMAKEVEAIRTGYGAFSSLALRRLIMAGRHVERLFSGGYQKRTFHYRYAIDEVPHYVDMTATKLGGRYTLTDIRGQDGSSPLGGSL